MGISAIIASIADAVASAGAAVGSAVAAGAGEIGAGLTAADAALTGAVGSTAAGALEAGTAGAAIGAATDPKKPLQGAETGFLTGAGGALGGAVLGPTIGALGGTVLGSTAGGTLASAAEGKPLAQGAIGGAESGLVTSALNTAASNFLGPTATPTSGATPAAGGGGPSAAALAAPTGVAAAPAGTDFSYLTPDATVPGTGISPLTGTPTAAGIGAVDATGAPLTTAPTTPVAPATAAAAPTTPATPTITPTTAAATDTSLPTAVGATPTTGTAGTPSTQATGLPTVAQMGAVDTGTATPAGGSPTDFSYLGGAAAAPGLGNAQVAPQPSSLTSQTPTDLSSVPLPQIGSIPSAGPTTTLGKAIADPSLSNVGDFLSSNAGILGAAGLMGVNMLKGNQQPKYAPQVASAAATDTAQGAQLGSYLTSGVLPPGLQAQIDAAREAADASARQQYANMGIEGSSSLGQQLGGIDISSAGQSAQIAENLLQQGISEGQLGASLYGQLMNASMQQDAALSSSIGNFAGALAGMNRPIYTTAAGTTA